MVGHWHQPRCKNARAVLKSETDTHAPLALSTRATQLLPLAHPFPATCYHLSMDKIPPSNTYPFKCKGQDSTFDLLSNEMGPFFVGPMPPEDFLDEFLLLSSDVLKDLPCFEKGMFSDMIELSQESEQYDAFVCFNSYITHFLETNLIFPD
jgi:hypothetical protein